MTIIPIGNKSFKRTAMNQAYYRKWRPSTWNGVVGQDAIVHTLHNAVTLEKFGHAYLFSGPRGTGKTSTARILAKALNCTHDERIKRPCEECENCKAINSGRFMDLIEIDAASNTSVDDIRDLREKINYSPTQGEYKVYIIDEVHMLSTAAFNALLKTLEEPPNHSIFILATTEIHKIPATVLSRCQRYEFRQIPLNTITAQLKEIAQKEDLKFEASALAMIARQATGSMRDAISLLDQIASTGEEITLKLTEEVLGTSSNEDVIELVEVMLRREMDKAIDVIHAALDSGTDARQFSNQVVEYLRSLLLIKTGNAGDVEVTQDVKTRMQEEAGGISIPALTEWIRNFNQALHNMGSRWQPSLALEMAAVESLSSGGEMAEKVVIPKSTGTSQPERKAESAPRHVAKNSPKEKNAATQTIASNKSESPEIKSQPGEEMIKEEVQVATQAPSQDVLLSNWKEIKAAVRQEKAHIAGLLNSCKSVSLDGNKLKLGFESEILLTKMNTEGNREVTQRAVKAVSGMDVQVECMVVKNNGNNNHPAEEHGNLVNAALSLGGEIVKKEKKD
ncbi:MAG: DNA polymerase III subunit gamma/tau [Chloroflexi bacterium]|nr:DNA polymerase III subunit gamma/tau [Chloroflexota bacterium]